MTDPVGPFEMRRLESLSNTIFGVAMTLLAYDLPKLRISTAAPDWADLYHTYVPHGSALILSFMVAGVYWYSHHRRLTIAPHGTRGIVFLNLWFLLLIILLPTVNGLYGDYRTSSVVAVTYGCHLILLSVMNAWLWIVALAGRRGREFLQALIPLPLFVVGTAVAFVAPQEAQLIWFLAFGTPLVGRLLFGSGQPAASP